MPNFASITIVGHLGRDPEIRDVGDKKVANFSVAVTRGKGDKEITSWYSCAAWGRQAEIVGQYLTKGAPVMIIGEPTIEEYELKKGDRAGQMATRVSVFVKDFTMLGSKKDSEQDTQKQEIHRIQAAKPSLVAAVKKLANAEDDTSEPPF